MKQVTPPAPAGDQLDSPRLVLRDGSVASVRPSLVTERNAIRRFFHDLSAESRRNRFFSASEPPDAVIARYRAAILQNPKSVMDRLGLEATGDGYHISDAASPGVRQAGAHDVAGAGARRGSDEGGVPSAHRAHPPAPRARLASARVECPDRWRSAVRSSGTGAGRTAAPACRTAGVRTSRDGAGGAGGAAGTVLTVRGAHHGPSRSQTPREYIPWQPRPLLHAPSSRRPDTRRALYRGL